MNLDDPTLNSDVRGMAEYWPILLKGRKLIIYSVVTGIVVAILLCLLETPKYRAVVVVNVERDAARLFEVTQDGQGYNVFDPMFFPTQVRLMRSREVAERVVNRLGLLGNPLIMPSRSGFFRLFGRKTGTNDVSAAALAIQANVTATPVPNTNLIELAYIGSSPKLTADVANALAETYIDWGVESKFQVVGQASKFLSTQIEQLKSDVDEKEGQLRAYGLQKDIISVDPKTNVTLQKLEMLNHDYASAMSERVAKEAHYYEVQYAANESLVSESADPTITQLRGEVGRLQRSYNEKLQLFKPEWPAMKQLKLQIDEMQKSLNAAVQSAAAKMREDAHREYLTAQRREQSLNTELGTQKREAMQLSSNAVEFNNLQNEVETKRTLLDTLQRRQAETEVTARLRGQRVATVRIVDRALVPGSPFSPSYPRYLLNALILSLAVGITLAFVRDFFDRSIRTVEQVEQYFRLPALGVIPAIGAQSKKNRGYYGYGSRSRKKEPKPDPSEEQKIDLVPHTVPRSMVAEAYRAMRTALLLSQAGGVRSMVITSCLPAEGKTSTALNLAVVLGQLEKRVLIIDADLHRPRIHEALHLSNRVGLVSLLVESALPTNVIQRTPIPNVSAILSGPTSPNPSGLLSSNAMRSLLEFATMNFDYVLIDSPPADSVADALILGSQTDGIILCVESGQTPRDMVVRLRNRMRQSNVNIIGVCINKLQEDQVGYYKSYRYHRYAGYTNDAKAAVAGQRS